MTSPIKISNLLYITVICILTFSVYYQLSSHDFLSLDDSVYVTDNPHVKTGLRWNNILWAFKSMEAEFWHPITWLSYMADTSIYGVVPRGYLFTNLLIHLINSILIFYLFLLMTHKRWESFFLSALFAIHPLHVETVAWISERKELLCGFFWLLSTIFYYFFTKSFSYQKYFLILLFFILGIMSKTMIITLPFTFFLLDFWPLNRTPAFSRGNFKKWCLLISEKIPLIVFSIAGGAITLWAQGRGSGIVSLQSYPISQRISNSLFSYMIYFKKTVWPEHLSVFYPVKDIHLLASVSSTVFLLMATGFFLYFSKTYRFLMTGWFWFLGTLVPVIGIVKIGDFSMADRYMYIPIVGLFIIFVFGISQFISKSSSPSLWKIIIPIIILGSYLPNTYFQVKTWQNSLILFNHSLEVVENNFLGHNGLGEYYASKGDINQALFHFSKAVELKPDKAALLVKLGRILYADNQKAKAVNTFLKAQAMSPDSFSPHFYLLCSFLDQEKIIDAQKQLILMYEKNNLLEKNSDYILFTNYFDRNEFDKSEKLFKIILTKIGVINPEKKYRTLIIKGYNRWEKNLSHNNPYEN